MKKIILLLGYFIIIILFLGCNTPEFSCKVTVPYSGAKVLINNDLRVSIKVTGSKNKVVQVMVYFDHLLFREFLPAPYAVVIPSHFLTLGDHTIKAVAVNSNGEQVESSVIITVVEKFDNLIESPDFVTFDGGFFPKGWKTYTWEIDYDLGYDDKYSARAANYPVALVFAYKTVDTTGFVQFYTKGGEVVLFIDGEKAQPFSSEPAQNWTKWVYLFEKGRHEFKWQAEGVYKYLDAISFGEYIKQ